MALIWTPVKSGTFQWDPTSTLLLYENFQKRKFFVIFKWSLFRHPYLKKIVVHFEKKWETGDVKIVWPGHLSHFSSNVSIKSLYIMIVAWGLSQ